MSTTVEDLAYLVAAVAFIVALKGLSSPPSARVGNLIGAGGALVAVVVVFFAEDMSAGRVTLVLAAVAVGSVVGVLGARRVAMTAMPQLVALFNGVGGAAAALVAILELSESDSASADAVVDPGTAPYYLAVAFTALVGSVSFSGSMITFAKLQELMTSRPVVLPAAQALMIGSLAGALGLSGWLMADGSVAVASVLAIVGLAIGVLLVLPVGGADVPIVISLLNAFTGLTVAASGFVLGNTLLLVAGTLVGASGTILTRLMAQAMGRSVTGILFGALKGGSTAGAGEVSTRPVRSASAEDIAILLGYAHKVAIVPGYGLAVAQAQHTIRELAEILEDRGVEVTFAIHPVAGRMPGHMNVLLAEANVPYEALVEMDPANSEMSRADVALVVGANDVVNPAAKNSPGSPIYGMPILEVDQAKAVVFLKRSMRPGFAGIENELLYDPKTTLLFGDAKASLTQLVASVKSL